MFQCFSLTTLLRIVRNIHKKQLTFLRYTSTWQKVNNYLIFAHSERKQKFISSIFSKNLERGQSRGNWTSTKVCDIWQGKHRGNNKSNNSSKFTLNYLYFSFLFYPSSRQKLKLSSHAPPLIHGQLNGKCLWFCKFYSTKNATS